MKDLVIKVRHIRREVIVWVGCLVVLTAWNAYAITIYHTQWEELISLWYLILPLSVLLYLILIPFRLLGCLLWRLFRKRRAKK